jgi:hypothetical protein
MKYNDTGLSQSSQHTEYPFDLPYMCSECLTTVGQCTTVHDDAPACPPRGDDQSARRHVSFEVVQPSAMSSTPPFSITMHIEYDEL